MSDDFVVSNLAPFLLSRLYSQMILLRLKRLRSLVRCCEITRTRSFSRYGLKLHGSSLNRMEAAQLPEVVVAGILYGYYRW